MERKCGFMKRKEWKKALAFILILAICLPQGWVIAGSAAVSGDNPNASTDNVSANIGNDNNHGSAVYGGDDVAFKVGGDSGRSNVYTKGAEYKADITKEDNLPDSRVEGNKTATASVDASIETVSNADNNAGRVIGSQDKDKAETIAKPGVDVTTNTEPNSESNNKQNTDPVAAAGSKADPVATAGSKEDPAAAAGSKADPVATAEPKTDPEAATGPKTDPGTTAGSKTEPEAANGKEQGDNNVPALLDKNNEPAIAENPNSTLVSSKGDGIIAGTEGNAILDDEGNLVTKTDNNTQKNQAFQKYIATIYTDGTYAEIDKDSTAVITVCGDLPSDAHVKAYPVEIEIASEDEEQIVTILAAFDIKIFSGDSEEIQPNDPVTVSITAPELENYDAVDVYHLENDEEALPELVAEAVATEETYEPGNDGSGQDNTPTKCVSFNADSFSIYVVANTSATTGTLITSETYPMYVGDTITLFSDASSYTNSRNHNWSTTDNSTDIISVTKNTNARYATIKANAVGTKEIIHQVLTNGVVTVTEKTNIVVKEVQQRTAVKTVDSTANGIVMYMFNYNSAASGIVIGGEYGTGETKQGLLNRRLTADGYPITTGGSSLKNLFTNGTQANHLFYLDEFNRTGYYYYNSAENFAEFNTSTKLFTVYNHLGTPSTDTSKFYYRRGNFMPFNKLNTTVANRNLYDEFGKMLSIDDPRFNEPIYGIGTNDFYFGMTLEANFYQPKNGFFEGEKMKFEFSGDDDMWVFIDGILVLDLGGIHDAQSGFIDFSTGQVGYTVSQTNDTVKPTWKYTTIRNQYVLAGETITNAMFAGDTFADYSSHKIQIFYMERGAGASNLKIRFNLPTLPKGDIAIIKDVQGVESGLIKNQEFTMQLYVENAKNQAAGFVLKANEPYKLYDSKGNLIPLVNTDGVTIERKTDSNGKFTIKDSEKAVFSGMQSGDMFYVVESGLSKDNYSVTYELGNDNGSQATPVNGMVQSSKYTYNYSDAVSTILTVRNVVAAEDQCSITVTKSFAGIISAMPKGFSALFKLQKVDESGNILETVASANYPGDFTDGAYTFNVLPGNYIVEESIDKNGSTQTLTYAYTAVAVNGAGSRINLSSDKIFVDNGFLTGEEDSPNNGTVAFTNYYGDVYHNITICKIGEENSTLSGVTFMLYEQKNVGSESNWVLIQNVKDSTDCFITDEEGLITLSLKGGTYKLIETDTVRPYSKFEGEIIFTVIDGEISSITTSRYDPPDGSGDKIPVEGIAFYGKKDGTDGSALTGDDDKTMLVVRNYAKYFAPETGGAGAILFPIIGIAVISATLALFIGSLIRSRKKKAKPVRAKGKSPQPTGISLESSNL